MFSSDFDLPSEEESLRLGSAIAAVLGPGDIVLLNGPLGAGKTFLARAIANALDVQDDVTSPTFALVHEYSGKCDVVHADLYRLKDGDLPRELARLGVIERAREGAIVLCEWGTPELFGNVAMNVRLDVTGPESRRAVIESERAIRLEARDGG